MRSRNLIVALACAGLFACSRDSSSTTETTSGTQLAPPDNTKINQREFHANPTPLSQGNDQQDLQITQKIRGAIVDDKSLSFDAKNVKVITSSGFVVLRGPVKTDEERRSIESAALTVVTPDRLDDEIEIVGK